MSQNHNLPAGDPGHGDSVASWTAVTIIMVAAALGTLFFWLDQPVLVILSGVLAVAGVGAGFVLKRQGYGVGGAKSKNNH